ncbi:MAG: hypothetical protein COV35_01645 [Alphaproteobacteria bacterium CG11_big_fil_rev_8_21_14_0_20_39_49]|nr:MAG: hypothetical protein COV35_01645 [Alphaproteobacteria bacterium CG11_big_fil_rev_8_21_14_0_20_39_49]
MSKILSSLSFLLFVTMAGIADAHLYWVEPNEFFFYNKSKQIDEKVSEGFTFEFTGGDTYFNSDTNRAKDYPENYEFKIIDSEGEQVAVSNKFHGSTRAIIEADLNKPQTYAIGVARIGEPMYYTKLKNGEYINKSNDELTDEESDQKSNSIGYYQYAKAYSTLHKTSDTWKNPLGHKLEIIPLSHPNLLYEGDTLQIKVLFNGKAAPNKTINAIYQNFRFQKHGEVPISTTTDKDGIASIRFDKANRYLITVSHDEKTENDNKAEGLNYLASLMLQVNEPWVKDWEK